MNTSANKKRATLSDVAKVAKVSRAAAGMVLNGGSAGIRVADVTRERILDAAQKLNYQPNMAARILAGSSSALIGVLIDAYSHFRSAEILRCLEEEANSLGYGLLVSSTHNDISTMKTTCCTLEKYGVSKIVCIAHDYPGKEQEVEKAFADKGNIVFLEKPFWDTGNYVATSRVAGLKNLIANLYRKNKRRLALVHGNLKWQSERSLLSDYKCALDECGLEYDPQFVISHTQTTRDIDIRSEFLLEKLLLLKNVDAVFIDDAPNALTLQGRLQSRGYKIPEDIIITGGDNDPFFSYLTPKIPTLRPQYHLIAKTLLNKLLEPNRNLQPVVIESEYVIEAQNQFFLP